MRVAGLRRWAPQMAAPPSCSSATASPTCSPMKRLRSLRCAAPPLAGANLVPEICCALQGQLGLALLAPLLPASLVPPPRQAVRARTQIVERETSREKNLEKAQKEAKVRARREAARAAEGAAPEAGAGAGDADALLQARPPLAARCPWCCMDHMRLNTSSAWAQSCLAQSSAPVQVIQAVHTQGDSVWDLGSPCVVQPALHFCVCCYDTHAVLWRVVMTCMCWEQLEKEFLEATR